MHRSVPLSLVLLVSTTLVGCPEAQPPVPSPPPPKPPAQPVEPDGDDVGPVGVEPSASDPDRAEDPTGAVETLRPRVVRRCCQNLAVALLDVDGAVARVAVSSGQVSFRAQLVVGDRLRLAKVSELEVLEVAEDGVEVRWLSEPDDPLGEIDAISEVQPEAGLVFLEEMGLYTVAGITVGVGNVRATSDGDASATLTVFPAGYATNPMQDWDIHADLLGGQTRKGAVRTLVVDGVGPRDSKLGWVRLRWDP